MSKSTGRSKRLRIILIGIAALFVLGGLGLLRLFNPDIGFVYFEPSYLPYNTSVKAKRITISASYTTVEQNFRTEDWVYSIIERKAVEPIGTTDQNYDAQSIKPTCTIEISPNTIRFRVCHWVDYGRINVHEIIFIKDGTYIYSQIPTALDQEITIQEAGKYVDSFERKMTFGFPVLHSVGA
jgi:hypothetical protein